MTLPSESCGPGLFINRALSLNGFTAHRSYLFMCQESKPRDPFSNADHARLHPKQMPITSCRCIQKAWLASRVIPRHRGSYLMPGAHRPINETNIKLAMTITRGCAFDLFVVLWSLHPVRTTLMMVINVVRGFFPAFRGYSQAMIVDEVGPPHKFIFRVSLVPSYKI